MSIELSPPLKSLLEMIECLKRAEVDVELLQAAVRSAEDSVTEYELRELRRFLQSVEGKLDLIRFTMEGEQLCSEGLKVAQEVSSEIRRVFGLPAT